MNEPSAVTQERNAETDLKMCGVDALSEPGPCSIYACSDALKFWIGRAGDLKTEVKTCKAFIVIAEHERDDAREKVEDLKKLYALACRSLHKMIEVSYSLAIRKDSSRRIGGVDE